MIFSTKCVPGVNKYINVWVSPCSLEFSNPVVDVTVNVASSWLCFGHFYTYFRCVDCCVVVNFVDSIVTVSYFPEC